MLLVVDVGNTHITLGVFDGKEIKATFRATAKQPRTSDEYGIQLSKENRFIYDFDGGYLYLYDSTKTNADESVTPIPSDIANTIAATKSSIDLA